MKHASVIQLPVSMFGYQRVNPKSCWKITCFQGLNICILHGDRSCRIHLLYPHDSTTVQILHINVLNMAKHHEASLFLIIESPEIEFIEPQTSQVMLEESLRVHAIDVRVVRCDNLRPLGDLLPSTTGNFSIRNRDYVYMYVYIYITFDDGDFRFRQTYS